MAVQQVLAHGTLDFLLVELARVRLRIGSLDLIDAQPMRGEEVVILVQQPEMGEGGPVARVIESVHFGDTAHGGHDGGAQLRHDG